MSRLLLFCCLFLCLGCESADESPASASMSVRLASFRCGTTIGELNWLRDLINRMDADPSLAGNIYAGSYDNKTVFIHQPWIMSCLACVVYDCEGNKLDNSTLDHEKLRILIDDWHVIYRPY